MKHTLKTRIHLIGILIVSLLLFILACDNVKNTTNFAIVEGFVFESELNKVGVEGVQVFIETDPNSQVTFQMSDIQTFTDSAGRYEARIFLSFESTGDQITDFVPNFLGDVRVAFFSGTKFFAITGLTVGAGKEIRAPDVFLTEFI